MFKTLKHNELGYIGIRRFIRTMSENQIRELIIISLQKKQCIGMIKEFDIVYVTVKDIVMKG